MSRETLADRVKRRIQALYAERRFTQTQLGDRVGLGSSGINPYIRGDRDINLYVLEAISELTQIPIAELVAPDGETIKQLAPDEAALLRFFRMWPASVRQSLIGFLEFFANESAPDAQTRNMSELWRRSTPKERDVLHSIALLQRERAIGADILAGVLTDLQREASQLTTDGRRGGRRARA